MLRSCHSEIVLLMGVRERHRCRDFPQYLDAQTSPSNALFYTRAIDLSPPLLFFPRPLDVLHCISWRLWALLMHAFHTHLHVACAQHTHTHTHTHHISSYSSSPACLMSSTALHSKTSNRLGKNSRGRCGCGHKHSNTSNTPGKKSRGRCGCAHETCG